MGDRHRGHGWVGDRREVDRQGRRDGGDRGGYRGRRGGRGYDRGYDHSRRGGERGNFQRSFVGHKRGREDDQGQKKDDSFKSYVIPRLMNLGEAKLRQGGEVTPAADIENFLKALRRDLSEKPELSTQLVEILLEAAAELSTKTAHISALVGLLNLEDREVVAKLVEAANESFNSSLIDGRFDRARLLLRFFTCLVVFHVLHSSSILALMDALMETALTISQGALDPSGVSWQRWTDYLVYMVVMALPWGGHELVESASQELQRLMEGVETYLGRRPIQEDLELKPLHGSRLPDDPALLSDSGGSSFLPSLWAAIKECRDNHDWGVLSIPNFLTTFEVQLAEAEPHDLPHVQVPQHPPGINFSQPRPVVAAHLRKMFPPRGGIRLLDKTKTEGNRPLIERFIAEEYILDVIKFYQGQNRAEQSYQLACGLPVPYNYEAILAETLFAQMLRLPRSSPPLIGFSTIIIDLCQLTKTFPRAMSACVRECFSRLPYMDPELQTRLADWLSYHLSNYGYTWPWEKWAHVLEAPATDAQRQFCAAVLRRLIRLVKLDWERIQQAVPEDFHELLGPRPDPNPELSPTLPPEPPRPERGMAAGEGQGNEGMEDGGEGEDAGVSMEDLEQQNMDYAERSRQLEEENPLAWWAGQMLQVIRSKDPNVKKDSDALLAWLEAHQVESVLGGSKEVLQMTLMAVLTAALTPTHMVMAAERYAKLLQQLIINCGGPEGEQVLMQILYDFWRYNTQRFILAVEALVLEKVLEPSSVLKWAFSSASRLRSTEDMAEAEAVWGSVNHILQLVVALADDVVDELERVEAKMERAERNLVAAANRAAEAAADLEAESHRVHQRISWAARDETRAREEYEKAHEARERVLGSRARLEEQRDQVLLQVFVEFSRWVIAEDDEDEVMNGDESRVLPAAEWHQYKLTQLRSFARRFAEECSRIVPALEQEVFTEEAVGEEVREVAAQCFYFPSSSTGP